MTLLDFGILLRYNDYRMYIHINSKEESDRYAIIKYRYNTIKHISIDSNGYHFFIEDTVTEEKSTVTFQNLINILDETVIINTTKDFYDNPKKEINDIVLKSKKITIR